MSTNAALCLLECIVMQTLRQFLKEVFRRASASMCTSIAIPAIGTGNLHIPHALVFKWMYDEAEAFSKKNPNTRLRDVRFVVYDKDAKTVAVIAVTVNYCVCQWS